MSESKTKTEAGFVLFPLLLSMNYFDLKDAVWDALSADVSDSFVIQRLVQLQHACSARVYSDETPSADMQEWFRASYACRGLSDGINGATYVRWHPSTKYAQRKEAERQRDRKRELELK